LGNESFDQQEKRRANRRMRENAVVWPPRTGQNLPMRQIRGNRSGNQTQFFFFFAAANARSPIRRTAF